MTRDTWFLAISIDMVRRFGQAIYDATNAIEKASSAPPKAK
jgi:hypothetical protein